MAERTRPAGIPLSPGTGEKTRRDTGEAFLEDVGTAPDQMGDRNRRRYGGHGSHDDGIYEDTLSDAGSIRGIDV